MRISLPSFPSAEKLSQLLGSSESISVLHRNKSAGIPQAVLDITQIAGSHASEKVKIQAIQERTALAVADYYTGGMASIAYGWAQRQWGGTLDKLRDIQAKLDPFIQIASRLFGSDKWQTEGNRLRGLIDRGVEIPESLRGAMKLTRGRSLEELVDSSVPQNFIGVKPDGTWVNNLFAATRDESYLKPEDIWGSAACFERFGNDWLGKFSEEQRRSICQRALDLGLVREHRGTIDIAWDKLPPSAFPSKG